MISKKGWWRCLLICTLLCSETRAQFNRYIIRLTDKSGSPFSLNNPSAFLSQRAIDRRNRYGIPLDQTDLPIPPRYLDSIRQAGNVTILNTSKWLNQVCISTTDAAALTRISGFPFVANLSPIAARLQHAIRPVNKRLDLTRPEEPVSPNTPISSTDFYNYGSSYNQVHLHNAEFLHNLGFRGQGMRISVMDAGFRNLLTLPTFDSIRNNGQVLETWDYVDQQESVDEDDSHGMKCLSTIAANMPGSFVGTAPGASFCLYRTEDAFSEYPVEEQNWVAAAERADSLGADLFSTSLGYTTFDNPQFDYSYSDMTGNRTLMARAANLAAKKGILVVAAAGNEGNSAWRYIATQGDADSALTIGAVNVNRMVASFSSYGPNSDGQIKPDVAAIGSNAIVAGTNTGQPVAGNGTSYATPIMAGIVTCLWQAFPELDNLELMEALRASADRYQNPDDRSGYGIPDVKKAFTAILQQLHTRAASIEQCVARIQLNLKAGQGMQVILERKLPSDTAFIPQTNQAFSGPFSTRAFSLNNNLAGFTGGIEVQYRIKMQIGTDTSFYLDTLTLPYSNACTPVTERKICPNTPTYFSVENTAPGLELRWQVNTGSGFADISDDARYTGSATPVLLLKNIPETWYGNQYRCRQGTGSGAVYSNPVTLKFATLWTGQVSTAWEDNRNWGCGSVPSAFVDVSIDGEAAVFPVVSFPAACHSLTTAPGSSVIIKTGTTLQITGP